MIKLSIIHPSRGRSQMAFETAKLWAKNASNPENIQYILSMDRDDPEHDAYMKLFGPLVDNTEKIFGIGVGVFNNNKNVVDAMNTPIGLVKGEIIIGLSDDFSCEPGWDDYILALLAPDGNTKEEALQVYDGNLEMSKHVLTLPILTKKLVDKLGYIYYPKYNGWAADQDLGEMCNAMGILKKDDTKLFEHLHWRNNKRPQDGTDGRHDNFEQNQKGRAILELRRQNNFGITKNQNMVIVTSLAPKHENSINQHRALESWKKFSTNTYSLNHISEIKALQEQQYDISIIPTKPGDTVEELFGKPLVKINALLNFAIEQDKDLLIINSDIILSDLPELKQDGITIFTRYDFKEDINDSVAFPHGFDAFFIPKKFLNIFPQSVFALGLCFHDYFTPLHCIIRNIPVYYPSGKYCFHQLHDAPSMVMWEKLGQYFKKEFKYPESYSIGQVNTESLKMIREACVKTAPLPASIDIFVKSHKPDFELLQLSLKTISKNVKGYNKIILLIPEKDKHEFDTRSLPERTEIHYVNDYGDGYLFQQICKLSAYKYSHADFIMMSDSDAFFDHPVDLQDLIKNGKPEILYTSYEELKGTDAYMWKAATEKFIGEEVKSEWMRRLQLTYHRDTLVHIWDQYPNLEKMVMDAGTFSEFNFLGAWCNKYEPDRYTFTNTKGWDYVPPMATQTWSHATDAPGVSEVHLREYIKLLKTLMKTFGVPIPEK